MNGVGHSAIGAGIGFVIAYTTGADPMTSAALVGAGGISGLVPDLDTGGKLTKKITLSDSLLKGVATIIGLLMIALTWFQGVGSERWLGILVGIAIIFFAQKLSKKIMLVVTGIGVIIAGILLGKLWLILIGVYIGIAALIPHRSYTHSLIGLAFFTYIANLFAIDVQVEGMFNTCVLGYASHLVADSRFIPGNKRGVKIFLPLSNKQF